ncbi:MAG: hypothetical protein ABIH63_02465 [archaeon]
MIPRSFIYQELMDRTAVIMHGAIWPVVGRKTNQNYFRWYTKTFGIEKGKELKDLQEDYKERCEHSTKTQDPEIVNFFINHVIRNKQERKEKNLEEWARDYFVCCNSLFEIKNGKQPNHEILIQGKSYNIDRKIMTLGEMEQNTTKPQEYENRVVTIAQQQKYYDRNEKLGIEKAEGKFYIHKINEPYALYERKNGKHYGFGRAKIGVEVENADGEVVWHDAVVMNEYMHPALKGNEAYQKICTGTFSFDNIRRKYGDKGKQIRVALEEARRMLERGYFSQQGSWNELTEEKYKELELQNTKGWRITNT